MVFRLWVNISCIAIIFLFLSCAAVSPAGGGPSDKMGPSLLSVIPINGTTGISNHTIFTLKFDENLNPQSVPAAVKITPETDYKIKTRGKIISIVPTDTLPSNTTFRIEISRSIRDYQDNKMDEAKTLVYTTGKQLSSSIISGKLLNTSEKVSSVQLYTVLPQDSIALYAKTEADSRGYFSIDYLDMGNYRIAAIENQSVNIEKDIYQFNYGLAPHDRFQIKSNNDTLKTKILIDDPLEKLSIKTIKFESIHHGIIILSNNDEVPFFLGSDKILNDEIFKKNYPNFLDVSYSDNQDTLYFSLSLENRLQTYNTNVIKVRIPEIQDTTPPYLSHSIWENHNLTLSFSEPVYYDSIFELEFIELDSTFESMPKLSHRISYFSPYEIHINSMEDSLPEITLSGLMFRDLSDSAYAVPDSIITLSQYAAPEQGIEKAGGVMSGSIIYHGNYDIVVTATNMSTNEINYTQAVNKKFKFNNLKSGKYTLFAYELFDENDKTIYFSGIWNPFRRAARFGLLDNPIEIRPRWEVQGIELTIDPGVY